MNTVANHWTLDRDADGVAWLTLDRQDAPANSLSEQVMRELAVHVAALAQNLPRALVILSGKTNGFVAGADISEFRTDFTAAQALELIRGGQQVLDQLAALPCTTVAAIHGFCLGGGLELALACRYRVASSDRSTSLGLPEVNLGIHPGFGGTVRAPALIGVRAAMPLMLTGAPVRADKALKLGLVDRVVPVAELRAAARGAGSAGNIRRYEAEWVGPLVASLPPAPPAYRVAPWEDTPPLPPLSCEPPLPGEQPVVELLPRSSMG
jgi:3-hydroxyacyl-CoA dehydrogenase/enoyl-CoA hydratase/3-hydroxybutyryl-CoA epimerase